MRSYTLTFVEQKPVRASNPMSFASILSGPAMEPKPSASKIVQVPSPELASIKTERIKIEDVPVHSPRSSNVNVESKPRPNGNRSPLVVAASKQALKIRKQLTAREQERITRAIDTIDSQALSDVEGPEFTLEEGQYAQRRKKRVLEVEDAENSKRKVRDVSAPRELC
jgi:chromatin-remodeling ATPase INO80